ncbi:MAG: ABC transporter substrate-binding protein [Thermoanaerobaculia bacterium]
MSKSVTMRVFPFAACLAIVFAVAGIAAPAPPFVFALRGKPFQSLSHLDAYTANAMTVEAHVMEGLMCPDPKKPDQPPLRSLAADHFEIDPRTFVFRLRKDVHFHPFPGHPRDPLTAEDVKFSLELAIRSRSPLAAELRDIASIETVGKDLIKIKLSRANRNFLAILATSIGHITSKTYFESLGKDAAARTSAFNRKPIGTGPYLLKQPLAGSKSIVLDRFDGYRDREWAESDKAVASITFRFYDDPKAILRGIEAGEVTMANLPLSEFGDGVNVSAGKGTLTKLTPPFLVILAINTAKAPLNDVRVRQLLNAAVITPKVMGICQSNPKELPPGFQYYMRIPQEYLKRSGNYALQRLLADPLTRPGLERLRKSGPVTILAPDRPDHIVDEILESVAGDLRANLGIETRIQRVPVVIREVVEKLKPDLAYVEWTPDTAEEHSDPSILKPLFESTSEYNIGGYQDKEVDRLFVKIRGITDAGTTEKIYNEIQKRLLENAPLIWLPSFRHWMLFLKTGYAAPYAVPSEEGSSSSLVHFTSIVKEIRTVP